MDWLWPICLHLVLEKCAGKMYLILPLAYTLQAGKESEFVEEQCLSSINLAEDALFLGASE